MYIVSKAHQKSGFDGVSYYSDFEQVNLPSRIGNGSNNDRKRTLVQFRILLSNLRCFCSRHEKRINFLTFEN